MSIAAINAAIVFAKTFILIKIFQLWNWTKTLKPFSMFVFRISIILPSNPFLAVLNCDSLKKVKGYELLLLTSYER